MFYDTTEWWTDSSQTKKVKAYRRKANYYERKREDLQDYLDKINNLLSRAESDYGLGTRNISTVVDAVLEYKFYEVESEMFRKTEEIINSLKNKRDVIVAEKEKASTLRQKYYNVARQEDY